jgi:1-deoxy-D-xylulose-5-phosphate synthase
VLVPVLRFGIPDQLVDHASPEQSKQSLGLTPSQMAERILSRFAPVTTSEQFVQVALS